MMSSVLQLFGSIPRCYLENWPEDVLLISVDVYIEGCEWQYFSNYEKLGLDSLNDQFVRLCVYFRI